MRPIGHPASYAPADRRFSRRQNKLTPDIQKSFVLSHDKREFCDVPGLTMAGLQLFWNHCLRRTFPSAGSHNHRQGMTKMTTRAGKSATAEEIAAIEDLMSDLEKRLRRLSGGTRREVSGASGEISDFVSEALDRIKSRVRETASDATQSIADEATRFGTDAFKKLTDEVEHRPLLMLAAAAGIGFIAGWANRR
jgi:ElaB/YqjD/DUF883 family membrane-anchored ribosome-binding protein